MDLLYALGELGGAARHRELLAAGVPERVLGREVLKGTVIAVGRGTYALPSAPPEVTMARLFRAQVGCVSACAHWGLPLWRTYDRQHLVVPPSRSSSRRDAHELGQVVLHRAFTDVPGRLWVPLAEAIDQASWCTSPMEQLVLLDAALHRGLLLPGDLAHLGLGIARRRAWVRRMASGTAESPLETFARVAFTVAGFRVEPQAVVPGVGRVDLVIDEEVAVEVDGWEFHQGRDAFERDRARDRVMLTRRMPVMRFTSRDVRSDLWGLVEQVACVLGREPRADAQRRLAWALGNSSPARHGLSVSAQHRKGIM